MPKQNHTPEFTDRKECSRCHAVKMLDEFDKDKKGYLGRVARCKDCIRDMRGTTPMKKKPLVQPGNKWCTGCERELSLSEFSPDIRATDGKSTRCRDCNSKSHGYKTRRRYLSDIPPEPEGKRYCLTCKLMKNISEFGIMHKPKGDFLRRQCNSCRQIEGKKRYADNPIYFDQYRTANHDQKLIKDKQYYLDHKDEIDQKNKQWRLDHPDEYVASIKNAKAKKPDHYRKIQVISANIRRTREKDIEHTLTKEEWDLCLAYFDNRCAVCGRYADDSHTISMDHVLPVVGKGGTKQDNVIPLCHARRKGVKGGCNNSKKDRLLHEWLFDKYPPLDAQLIYDRIMAYFEYVKTLK